MGGGFLKLEITLRCLLVLFSLSACGGSSSGSPAQGKPPDTEEPGGQAGTAEVSGASAGGSGGHTGGVGSTGSGGRGGAGAGGGGSDSGGRGGAGSGGSAGAAAKPTLGCAGWQLDLSAGNPSSATLVDGGVKLVRPVGTIRTSFGYFNSADVALEQTGLVGDFDITISFKDFVPGDAVPFSGPRLSTGVWWHDSGGSGRVYQAHGSVGQTTGGVVLSHGDQLDIKWLDPSPAPASLIGASGTIHVKRVGGDVSVEANVNGQVTNLQSTEPFPEEPLTLFIGFDDYGAPYGEPSTLESGVTITNVQVTGGGGLVMSDDFSCE